MPCMGTFDKTIGADVMKERTQFLKMIIVSVSKMRKGPRKN